MTRRRLAISIVVTTAAVAAVVSGAAYRGDTGSRTLDRITDDVPRSERVGKPPGWGSSLPAGRATDLKAFPTQTGVGYTGYEVTNLEVGPVASSPFVLTGAIPDSASVGTSTPVQVNGSGFINPLPIQLSLVEIGGDIPITDGTIDITLISSPTAISTLIELSENATPRTIEIRGYRKLGEFRRIPFTILP